MKNPFLLLFPPRCAVCGKVIEKGYICEDCFAGLPRITGPRCRICGIPMGEYAMPECAECRTGVPYEKCFVPFSYRDGVKRGIARMKFHDHPAAYRYFAREIAAEIGGFRPDFITFVPQNRRTRRVRGYNQTELIAKELGKLLGLPVKSTLVRGEKGEKQVDLSRSKRLENARRLYRTGSERLSGSCLIVDDVITTGATMRACCTLLRKMGCEKVYAAAIARTERH